jgi:hypothetical protein
MAETTVARRKIDALRSMKRQYGMRSQGREEVSRSIRFWLLSPKKAYGR